MRVCVRALQSLSRALMSGLSGDLCPPWAVGYAAPGTVVSSPAEAPVLDLERLAASDGLGDLAFVMLLTQRKLSSTCALDEVLP